MGSLVSKIDRFDLLVSYLVFTRGEERTTCQVDIFVSTVERNARRAVLLRILDKDLERYP